MMYPYDAQLLAAVSTPPASIPDVIRTMEAIDGLCVDGDGLKSNDRGVLPGEGSDSKSDGQGSTPCAPAERIEMPSECEGRHTTLRTSGSGFDSWQGH